MGLFVNLLQLLDRHVGVDLGGGEVLVSEHLLDVPHVGPAERQIPEPRSGDTPLAWGVSPRDGAKPPFHRRRGAVPTAPIERHESAVSRSPCGAAGGQLR